MMMDKINKYRHNNKHDMTWIYHKTINKMILLSTFSVDKYTSQRKFPVK